MTTTGEVAPYPAQRRRGAAPPPSGDQLTALAAELIAVLDDAVLLVDATLRVLGGNPALAARLPISAFADDAGRLRPPGLVRLARHALSGSGSTAQAVELQLPSPATRRPPQAEPMDSSRAGGSSVVCWTPLVRAIALERPIRACALVLRDRDRATEGQSARDLVTTLAHELKGPLFQAQQAVDVLTQSATAGEADVQAAVDRAAGSIRRIATLVRDLSDVVSLDDHRRLVVRRRATDPATLMTSVIETYQALASARGTTLDLAVDLAAPVPTLELDPDLVTRALANLVDNALKHGTPGSVSLRLRRAGSLVNLEVIDRGPGIHPADQRRIFEPFVRLPAADNLAGSGLGLALAQRIARAHGGTLTVESRPGAGATFRLSLLVPPGL